MDLFIPCLQKSEPKFSFPKNIHSSEVTDDFEARGERDGCSQLTQKLIQHGITGSLNTLKQIEDREFS